MPLYIVLHHEIFYRDGEYIADEMVFHVASSLENALDYIRACRVDPYSWWELQVGTLDNPEWPEHYGWYRLRGGKLKNPPYEKAVAAYKRCKQDPNHHLSV